jgi:hypothetical protein
MNKNLGLEFTEEETKKLYELLHEKKALIKQQLKTEKHSSDKDFIWTIEENEKNYILVGQLKE